jgi:hypothetical protein
MKKGLGEVKDMSIEAKAGIVGMMYGLERMMAISGATGTALTNFSAFTGKSAQDLQKWQFAARQAGVGAEEMTAGVKSVQAGMANMLLGKGAPEGIALLSKSVGGLDPTKYRDTFYMLTQLQKGMQKMAPEMGNMVGKSFGLSEGMIAAMRRNAFTPEMFAKAPTYSDKEVGSLDKSNIAWANLGNKIEMAFGHFNAKHGQQLVKEITTIVNAVEKLASAFVVLAEKLQFFKGIAKVFDGWTMIFNGLTGAVKDVNADKKGVMHGMWDKLKGGASEAYDAYKGMQIEEQENMQKSIQERTKEFESTPSWLNPHPKMPSGPQGQGASNTTINQTITHIGDAKDTKAVKDTHKHAVSHAYRQRSAQRQGS